MRRLVLVPFLIALPSLAQAAELHASSSGGAFELSTYRLLQSHLARGLRVMP